jgi:DNA invertase Pin-like site-specific DNA recombinase
MNGKIGPLHLERQAYVYIRQSTPGQVRDHIESKQRQYALAERAVALGWNRTAVEIVDEDQAKSGSSTHGRDGFARLAHEVAHGKVGAILALEVSRLARSSQDWQRLLSLCAVAHVVVIDEQTVYDPSHRDDKLLLDLKGAMSEQELHWLSLRLAGGRLNKARRGESYVTPPTGYVWGGRGLELDPDEAVRRAVEAIFQRFAIEPSARAVLRWAATTGFLMPVRDRGSAEVSWVQLGNLRLNTMLKNRAYAGVYVFGRHPIKTVLVDGEIRKVRTRLDEPTEWPVRIDNAQPAYITWGTYMSNRDKLRQNKTQPSGATRGAPREGAALLAGLIICGRCGRRMSARYGSHAKSSSWSWSYTCWGEHGKGRETCWSVAGAAIDRAVEKLFLETMVPSELDLSLAVEREVHQQADSLEKAWRARIEQARYEARRAERRYKAVEPDNRVVARTLESDWEQRLRELETVEQQYAEARRTARVELTTQDRERIRQLARDLPAVWAAPTTLPADRKAMLRLAIKAVAVNPVEVPRRSTRIKVQWASGAVDERMVPRFHKGEYRKNPSQAIQRIRELAAGGLHDDEIAARLGAESLRTGTGLAWHEEHVRQARSRYDIERTAPDRPRIHPLPHRHPERGWFSIPGAMARFGVNESMVRRWIVHGLVRTTQSDFGQHRNVRWLDIDDVTAARLAARLRDRTKAAARRAKA